MKRIYILRILFFLSFSYSLKAQTILEGQISNTKGEKLSGILVVLKQLSDNMTVKYAYSDASGKYKLFYSGKNQDLTIVVSSLPIRTQSKQISNKNQVLDFIVEEKDIQLREVQIKSAKIWGTKDTVNYLVSSFSSEKDQVIGDVLKKMPGIEVEESGQIKYQGKAINKFYIENLDMLQGRYGIATQNISAKDVSTVQVLENHQPIKALDGLRLSTDPAINLKLKNSAKGTWVVMAQLGLGVSPMLWNNELTGMYFGKGRQNISTYKGNNSGLDLSKELNSFTTSNNIGGGEVTQIETASPPGIEQSRYLFNNSNAATANNLILVGENKQLNFNLIYLNDHEKRDSYAKTSYLLPGQNTQTIIENLSSGQNIDRLETEIRYNVDENRNYFNDYLNVSGFLEKGAGDVTTDNETIHQSLYRSTFNVSNTLQWIKKSDNEKGFELNSSMVFKSTPQDLTIHPGSYADLFDQKYSGIEQEARINSFCFDNRLSLLSMLHIGNVLISPGARLNISNQNLHSELYPMGDDSQSLSSLPDSLKNNLNWTKSTLSVGTNLSYKNDNFEINLSVPVNYLMIQLKDKLLSENQTMNRLYFQPYLSTNYKLTSNVAIDGRYSFFNQTGDIYSLYSGYILQDYRSLNCYSSNLTEWRGNGGSVNISYKDLFNMLFFRLGASYNYYKRAVLYGQNFSGIISTTTMIEQPNASTGVSINGRISKGIGFLGLVTTLDGSYTTNKSMQLQQNKIVNYEGEGINLNGSLSAKVASWLFTYKGSFGESLGKITSGEKFSSIRSFVNKLSLDIPLLENWGADMGYEHYYNSAAIENKNFSLVDLGMNYRWNRYYFILDWTNIFNTKKYITSYYNGLNTYYSAYNIRPENVLLKMRFKLK
jgi:hypothetical protein